MRPKRLTILETTLTNGRHEQIFAPEDNYLYVVTLDMQPIGIRVLDPQGWAVPKYKTTVYPNRGYAEVTVKKLNQRYNTDRFQVIAIKIS